MDLTKIDKPLGELDDETAAALLLIVTHGLCALCGLAVGVSLLSWVS